MICQQNPFLGASSGGIVKYEKNAGLVEVKNLLQTKTMIIKSSAVEKMLHTKYQGSRHCGFREDFFMFSLYKPMQKLWPLGLAHFLPQLHNLNKPF